jgi:peptidoglycan pentaglycine glycine transferase (the first glycine)
MQAVSLGINHRDKWNELVLKEPYFALMQSWEWGEYKEKLGWHAFRIAVEQDGVFIAGAQLLIELLPLNVASIAYIPRGPIGNWLADDIFKTLITKIFEIIQSYNSIFLRIDPPLTRDQSREELLFKNKFRKARCNTQPQATIIMDISQNYENILKGMRGSTRRKILTAEHKGVEVISGDFVHLSPFYELMKITSKRGGFVPKSFEYYQKQWETFQQYNQVGFFLACFQENIIAAHIAYCFGQHAAFFHQVSSSEYGNLNANSLLVGEEIKWAKSRNCISYDLWGIPDDIEATTPGEINCNEEERTDGLWGVYKFKRGFSKNIVCFIGTFDLVLKPLLYTVVMSDWVNNQTIDQAQYWLDRLMNLR